MPSSSSSDPYLSSAPSTWRQFSFWESKEIKSTEDLASSPPFLRSLTPPYVLISPSSRSPLADRIGCIVSTSDGYITLLDKVSFQVVQRWRAWAAATEPPSPSDGTVQNSNSHTAAIQGGATGASSSPKLNPTTAKAREQAIILLERGGILLGIAEDDSSSQFPLLKIWDLNHTLPLPLTHAHDHRDRSLKSKRSPVLMRSVRIGTGSRGYPISSISASSNLSYLAIGLISGQVLLYRHLAQSLQNSPGSFGSFPKPRVVWEGSLAEPITGLGFREPGNANASANANGSTNVNPSTNTSMSTALFISTPNKTIVISSVTGKGTEPLVLDETLGAALGCSSMDSEGETYIVGRDDGFSTYGLEGRTRFIAYEGEKSNVHVHGQSIAFVSPPYNNNSSNTSRGVISGGGGGGAGGGLPGSPNAAKLTVFDLENKFIAYTSIFKEGVERLFSTGQDDIFLITGDGKLWRLAELSNAAKLDILYRKNLFQLAISVAQAAEMDDISDIYARYGEYLYNKGDFEGAMSQFVKTLGHLQPSYVIRKYLDAQRIHSLITYLQELHAVGLATPDHTTLLLNCYTKTDDEKRLWAFLRQQTAKTVNDADLRFDLDTAIRVCRQAGFYENALYLARRYQRHQEYLQIQLEDRKDFEDALAYLRALSPLIAQQNLLRYGKTMLDDQTENTTDLLIDLCSGTYYEARAKTAAASSASAIAVSKHGLATDSGGPRYLSYLGYDSLTGVFGQGEKSVTQEQQAESTAATATGGLSSSHPSQPPMTPPQKYDIPSAQLFFALFIDHPIPFTHFLESVAKLRWDQVLLQPARNGSHLQSQALDPSLDLDEETTQQRAIWNTLLELYLTTPENQPKASQLLGQAGRLPVDPMHALILCFTHNFVNGQIALWEKLGMYEDIVRYFMQQEDGDGAVIHHLHMYGPTNLHLYPMVLRYLSSSPALLSKHSQDVSEILAVIDEERIMPPLEVIQLLSRNNVATIGLVKDWLKSRISETRQDIESNRALVTSYRSETAEKLQDIANLASLDKPQVFQVTRCALCGGQLDLPAVHFMCKHSYHQR